MSTKDLFDENWSANAVLRAGMLGEEVEIPTRPVPTTHEQFKDWLRVELGALELELISKNRKYGNAALDPIRVFSSASAVEQLKVRIDDKLKRVQNQQKDEDEDAIFDLIGYLLLLRCAQV